MSKVLSILISSVNLVYSKPNYNGGLRAVVGTSINVHVSFRCFHVMLSFVNGGLFRD